MHRPSPQRGFTLVELMVAMTLGLLVSAAVVSLYISTSRNYAEDERYARMQENGRYTLQVLTDDLAMVDFWGKMMNVDTIGTGFTPPTGTCEVNMAMYDGTTALLFNNYHLSPPSMQFTPCAQVTTNKVPNSDVLVVKRVASAPTSETFVDVADIDGDGDTTEILTTGASDLQNGTVYLRTNATTGNFLDDASSTNPPGVAESDWRYQPRVYFLRDHFDPGDGIPSLCRMDISGTGLAAPECLAQGIEDLHIQFGLDTDGDGIANEYVSDPTLGDMEKVVTARVYILVRSIDVDPTYTDTNTYVLGDVNIASPNDGYYRRVYTSTVGLRNPTYLHVLNQ
jgi:type IV pilus assembly protein PilW